MKRYFSLLLLFSSLLFSSCYEEYTKDYEASYVYFATARPLRTLVDGNNMSIKVGVGIGGKREVNTSDWATFSINPSLLDIYPELHLMPDAYYTLADGERMTISNPNLAIADVKIDFSDEYYQDPKSYLNYYAIPFRITDHSLDEISKDNSGILKDYTIVVVKAVSKYHGYYYVRGTKKNLQTGEETTYYNNDLSKNSVRSFSSLDRNTVNFTCTDLDSNGSLALRLTINEGGSVSVENAGTVPVSDVIGVLDPDDESLSFTGGQPKFVLAYTYILGGVQYRVNEELIRRQNPEADLRFEEWTPTPSN